MNIRLLEIFVQVAQKLSFVAVAEELDLKPSTVSRSVAQLEELLSVRLFHRTTRSMTLTEAGEYYFARVAGILDELDAASHEVKSLSSNPHGALRLTSSVAFGEEVLMPLIGEFRHRYPDIRLHLLFNDENVDLVRERIDLAVRLGRQQISGLIAIKLKDTTYRIYATKPYLKSAPPLKQPGDLAHHQIIHYGLQTFRSSFWFKSKVDGITSEFVFDHHNTGMVISSPLSLRTAIKQGQGIGLLADWLAKQDVEMGTLIDVFPGYEIAATEFDTAVFAIYPSRSFLPQKTRVMIDFLKEHL